MRTSTYQPPLIMRLIDVNSTHLKETKKKAEVNGKQ
jgi:hypothetical protein